MKFKLFVLFLITLVSSLVFAEDPRKAENKPKKFEVFGPVSEVILIFQVTKQMIEQGTIKNCHITSDEISYTITCEQVEMENEEPYFP